MAIQKYRPEGFEPSEIIYSHSMLEKALLTGQIVEGRAVKCDENGNLTVSLGKYRGIIPKNLSAIGSRDGKAKDIAVLSRVNKTVAFKIISMQWEKDPSFLLLDRCSAQEEAMEYMLENFSAGDVIDAKVTHIEPFGVFADIGCGIIGLLSIENISVSRISHPKDRFYPGQNIKVCVKNIDFSQKRFDLSHKELLGTWQENADMFTVGQTVCGIIRSIEPYGVFIELSPNLAGLAEYSPNVEEGQQATVYIKNIIPEKMKIKLSIIDSFFVRRKPEEIRYFISSGKIDRFVYSPADSDKKTETVFSDRR